MLVLQRKCHEGIRIGENVWLKVLHTGRRSVKLGIEAPADVSIARLELLLGELTGTPPVAVSTAASTTGSVPK